MTLLFLSNSGLVKCCAQFSVTKWLMRQPCTDKTRAGSPAAGTPAPSPSAGWQEELSLLPASIFDVSVDLNLQNRKGPGARELCCASSW